MAFSAARLSLPRTPEAYARAHHSSGELSFDNTTRQLVAVGLLLRAIIKARRKKKLCVMNVFEDVQCCIGSHDSTRSGHVRSEPRRVSTQSGVHAGCGSAVPVVARLSRRNPLVGSSVHRHCRTPAQRSAAPQRRGRHPALDVRPRHATPRHKPGVRADHKTVRAQPRIFVRPSVFVLFVYGARRGSGRRGRSAETQHQRADSSTRCMHAWTGG